MPLNKYKSIISRIFAPALIFSILLWGVVPVTATVLDMPQTSFASTYQIGDEIVELRDQYSKTYLTEIGYSWSPSIESQHYQDSEGAWQEIETTIIPSDRPNWDWEVTTGHWQLFINNNTTVGIKKDGNWVGTRLHGIAYLDITTKDYSIIQTANDVTPVVSGNEIRWNNILYGVDLVFRYTNDSFKEDIIIRQEARDLLNSPGYRPLDYGYSAQNTYLVPIFECDWSQSLPMKLGSGLSVNPDEAETDGNIYFESTIKDPYWNTNLVSFLPVDYAVSANPINPEDPEEDWVYALERLKKRLVQKNDKHWLLIGAPVVALNQMPEGSIIFDPTETLRPNAAGAEESIASATSGAGNHHNDVDDVVTDEGTTVVYTSSMSYQRDLYNLPASSGIGTINFVKIYVRCKGQAANTFAKPSLKSNGTVTDGTEVTLNASWVTYSQQWNTNPAPPGTDPWEWADIDALQIGVSLKGSATVKYAWCTQVWVEVDYTEAGAPTLDTTDATLVEETTATLEGEITATGGENADFRGFVWDTATHGDPGDTAPVASDYASYWTEGGDFGVEAFDHAITGLTQGELYYYRACAHNSNGWAYGDEVTLLTKPEAPTGFTATSGGDGDSIDLAWTKGTGAQKTYIRGKEDAYPANRADGVLVYNDTGVSYGHTGLDEDDDWYYRAWSYATEGGKEQYSDAYAQDWATATAWAEPTVTTNIFLGFGGTWAVLSGTINDEGDAGVTQIGFDYGLTDAYGSDWTTTGSWTTDDTFVGVITGLTRATVFHYRAKAYNDEWGYGSDMMFATEGSPAIYEYLNTGGDGASGDIYGNNWGGQSFTIGATSHTITSFRVYIKRTGSPGTVTLSLKHATGAGLPTGADITSGTLDGDAISDAYTWYEITTIETPLEAGEKYAIVIRAVAGDDANDIQWRADTGGGLANAIGCSSTDGGITWGSDAPADYLFEIWGNPCLDLVTGAVFSGYLEDDDMLFLIHYKNIYAPYYPYDDPNQYFNLQVLDTDGTTLLAQVPCQQWGYMPGSVYIKADNASGLTYGAGYYLRIYGTFTGNPSSQYQLTADDWLGTTGAYLDQWVLHTAYSMEDYYEIDLTTSVPGQGTVLNEVGGVAFAIGIPELEVVRPDLFQEVARNISHTDYAFIDEFSAATTWQAMVGEDLEAVAGDAGTIFGLDDSTMIGIGLLIGYIGLAVFVFAQGHTSAGLALAFPFIIIAGALRVIDIAIIAIVAIVMVLLTVWSFWFTRT